MPTPDNGGSYNDAVLRYMSIGDNKFAGNVQIFRPQTDDDYDQMPIGSWYMDPDDHVLMQKSEERKGR